MDANKKLRERLASNIKQLMKHTGIKSQAHLAELTGVSQSHIGNLLRGERGASIDTLESLAIGLECEPWLMLSPTKNLVLCKDHEIMSTIQFLFALLPSDLDAITRMTKQLYLSSHTGFPD